MNSLYVDSRVCFVRFKPNALSLRHLLHRSIAVGGTCGGLNQWPRAQVKMCSTNLPSDSERLTSAYGEALAEAPTRIAPERDAELLRDLFGGTHWSIRLVNGDANFVALLDARAIEARYSALLSLWAVSAACLRLSHAMGEARHAGLTELDVGPGTPASEALRLLEAANNLIRNPNAQWPTDLPIPTPSAAALSQSWAINNLFLGAAAWCVFHEIAHIRLGHESDTTAEIRRTQEFEADQFATRWVLDRAPHDLTREFRIFSIVVGLAWLGVVDLVRGIGATHPPAPQRLLNCAEQFLDDDMRPALQMGVDVLTAMFNPHDRLPPSETPADAFIQIALRLRGEH